MAERTTPPFRADHVGSLLRPGELLEARERHAAGRLSVASPLAQAALGRREGDVVVVRAPRGEMRYTVVALE